MKILAIILDVVIFFECVWAVKEINDTFLKILIWMLFILISCAIILLFIRGV